MSRINRLNTFDVLGDLYAQFVIPALWVSREFRIPLCMPLPSRGKQSDELLEFILTVKTGFLDYLNEVVNSPDGFPVNGKAPDSYLRLLGWYAGAGEWADFGHVKLIGDCMKMYMDNAQKHESNVIENCLNRGSPCYLRGGNVPYQIYSISGQSWVILGSGKEVFEVPIMQVRVK